jgi:hypothetical protein
MVEAVDMGPVDKEPVGRVAVGTDPVGKVAVGRVAVGTGPVRKGPVGTLGRAELHQVRHTQVGRKQEDTLELGTHTQEHPCPESLACPSRPPCMMVELLP